MHCAYSAYLSSGALAKEDPAYCPQETKKIRHLPDIEKLVVATRLELVTSSV